jgi:hypothetical protein
MFFRFSRPQSSGYELASQEELLNNAEDDLDEDFDDFEVTSSSGGGPTLRLHPVDEEPETTSEA